MFAIYAHLPAPLAISCQPTALRALIILFGLIILVLILVPMDILLMVLYAHSATLNVFYVQVLLTIALYVILLFLLSIIIKPAYITAQSATIKVLLHQITHVRNVILLAQHVQAIHLHALHALQAISFTSIPAIQHAINLVTLLMSRLGIALNVTCFV